MIARVHLTTLFQNGVTTVGSCSFSAPLRVMNITEHKLEKALHLMLMSTSPGILDEDAYTILIRLEEKSTVQLHTQSYQRLFNMVKSASQNMRIQLMQGASFTYLPHPSVPHERSIFTSENTVRLANNCQLIWGEILTCGRKLKGEIFTLSKYHSITNIYLNEKLVIKENLLMQPQLFPPNSMGHLEGFTHQASLIILNENVETSALANTVNNYLTAQPKISFGITTTPINGLAIRILGYQAEQLFSILKTIAALV